MICYDRTTVLVKFAQTHTKSNTQHMGAIGWANTFQTTFQTLDPQSLNAS